MTDRQESIELFSRAANFENECHKVLTGVLKFAPISIMIAYELIDGTVHVTTVPYSVQLAKGFADTLYTQLWQDETAEAEDESEGVL